MKIILDHLDTLPPLPTLLGGDWNTTTFNAQSSRRAILGYWRRVMMGVKNVVKNHYPHPDRYFEKRLFGELESRGFEADRPWKDATERKSQLVFIGRDLDREALNAGFRRCLA